MMINETVNLNGNITLKDVNGTDVIVAYVTSSLDASTENFNINMNITNKVLLDTTSAVNVAGESVKAQYAEFETAVTARAKELGYEIFA